jgi:serine protease AprX
MRRSSVDQIKCKAVWGARPLALFTGLLFVFGAASHAFAAGPHARSASHATPGVPGRSVKAYKLDGELTRRASNGNPTATSSVIVTLVPGATLPSEFKKFARNTNLDIINGQVLDVPNNVLRKLEAHPGIFRIHENRAIHTHNYRTSVTVGAATVRETLGYTGAGITVAVIDSGITTWHDDLTSTSNRLYPYGNQRVAKFVDFVNGRTLPYDDNGHGSHVAGIIAGNGYDSKGEKAGLAPDASIISLKVLDANGSGTIGNIIAALNWVAVNARAYNIRVVNMSVGASIRESYWTDPLTLAAKAVTDKGITIVTAAGNLGTNAAGAKQYGGIAAPGNAPWVLTIGASSTMGTLTRLDDTMAGYSSRGPTYKDFGAKPDLVAPGTGTISLAVPGSTFYYTKAPYLVSGSRSTGAKAYLALSGTSMASPVAAGTVALMLQANPNLTPNLIKAILQYTAQIYPGYNALEQGAGFLNTLGAVRLAKFYASHRVGDKMPVQSVWSRQLIWGNHKLTGGYINPRANAWAVSVVWGAARTLDSGDNIVWGTNCAGGCDNIIWGTADDRGDNIIWGTSAVDNIVWGTMFNGDNIIWGTSGDDNIVWGTDCGGADCDNIVWGTADADNIIWGTADLADNIIWGTSGDDNIVWGTSSGEDATWGTSSDGAELFADEATDPLPDPSVEFGEADLAVGSTSLSAQ